MPSLCSDGRKTWNSPYINRFLQPDIIIPDLSSPQSWNRYSYVANRPVNFNDPSGHKQCDGEEGDDCTETGKIRMNDKKDEWASRIEKRYRNITVSDPHSWSLDQLKDLFGALYRVYQKFGSNADIFDKAFGNIIFVPVSSGTIPDGVADANWDSGVIRITPGATYGNFIHEMGHIFDGHDHQLRGSEGYFKSQLFVSRFNAGDCKKSPCYKDDGWDPTGQTTDYAAKSSLEDFADAFAAVMGEPYSVSQERQDIVNLWISQYTGSDNSPH